MSENVINNEANSRFEIETEQGTALLNYKRKPGRLELVHTEVPEALEGRGLGGELARAALDYARSTDLEVAPLCSFVIAYVKRHQEYLHVIAPEYRSRVSASI
jgi:uncharacterized protein